MSKVSNRIKRWRIHLFANRMIIIFTLGSIAASAVIAPSSSDFAGKLDLNSNTSAIAKTITTNGSDQWDDDETVTAPAPTFSFPATEQISISPLFNQYFQSHPTAHSLGNAVTVAFPTDQGWIQFFQTGALLLPTRTANTDHTNHTSTIPTRLKIC